MDEEWYCLDENGYLGFMTTGGYGIPILNDESFSKIMRGITYYVNGLKETSVVDIITSISGVGDWVKRSEKGLFCFDYNHNTDEYEMFTMPQSPIKIAKAITHGAVQVTANFLGCKRLPGSILNFTC